MIDQNLLEGNKYFKWYWSICNRAKDRVLSPDTYVEKHHVYPNSIYGQNQDLVKLTAKEHYIVHLLLWWGLRTKYGTKDKNTRKMAYAFTAMNMKHKCTKQRYNSKLYSFLKISHHEKNDVAGINNPMYGRCAYDIWLKKYGKEYADNRYLEKDKKLKESNKTRPKNTIESNNKRSNSHKEYWENITDDEYNNRKSTLNKKPFYNCWIEKYGKEEADKKYDEYIEKLKVKRKGKIVWNQNLVYVIETPTGEIIKIVTRKKVQEYLKCSGNFFQSKKFKGYKLISINNDNCK